MQNKCTISEHTPSIWRTLIVGGAFMTVLFFVFLVVSKNPLYNGIFRLIAFIGLTVVVLSYLQVRGESQEIELLFDNKHLTITYFSKSKKNQEELFETDTIATIRRIENPPVWKIIPRRDCSEFRISFTDSKHALSLFRFEGRDLCVSHPDARKVERFLEENLS